MWFIWKRRNRWSTARKFADKIKAIFKLTSAKNDVGINDLFKSLAEEYLNKNITKRTESFLLNNENNGGCCKKKKCC